MDFDRILITDRLAMELLQAADREDLLFVKDPGSRPPPRKRRNAATQRALSLLVLFDKIVIHNFTKGDHCRIPELEKEGFVEIVSADWRARGQPFKTQWTPTEHDSRARPTKQLLQSLALVRRHLHLIVNRLISTRALDFIDILADWITVSRRRAAEMFIDYAILYVQADPAALRAHPLHDVLSPELKSQFFNFKDPESSMNVTLLMAMVFAEEIAVIEEISARTSLPVATEFYGSRFRGSAATGMDALAAANNLIILQAAFAKEGRFMPPITTIADAVSLRKDPYLRAIREHLKHLHNGLMSADGAAVIEARREIQKAQRRLELRAGFDKALRWLAYLAVPATVAETLLNALPIISFSLTIIGAAGAAASRRTEKRNEWVMFGS